MTLQLLFQSFACIAWFNKKPLGAKPEARMGVSENYRGALFGGPYCKYRSCYLKYYIRVPPFSETPIS